MSHTCRVDQVLEPLGLVLAQLNVDVVALQGKVDLGVGKGGERGRQIETRTRRLGGRERERERERESKKAIFCKY
jgi:hypothetical protein